MIYGYLRLSTTEENQSNSFDVQRNHIESRHKIDLFYQDTCSGSTPFFKRDGWSKLMAILKSGDKIIVHRLDRLSRDTMNYLVMENELKRINVSIIFVDGIQGNDPMAEMVRTILSSVAEYERKMIALRIQQAKDIQRSQGKHLSGHVNYGYYKDSEGYLVENEEEQHIIGIMRELRSKNLSYQKIADAINARGYRTRKGVDFTSMAISRAVNYKLGVK